MSSVDFSHLSELQGRDFFRRYMVALGRCQRAEGGGMPPIDGDHEYYANMRTLIKHCLESSEARGGSPDLVDRVRVTPRTWFRRAERLDLSASLERMPPPVLDAFIETHVDRLMRYTMHRLHNQVEERGGYTVIVDGEKMLDVEALKERLQGILGEANKVQLLEALAFLGDEAGGTLATVATDTLSGGHRLTGMDGKITIQTREEFGELKSVSHSYSSRENAVTIRLPFDIHFIDEASGDLRDSVAEITAVMKMTLGNRRARLHFET